MYLGMTSQESRPKAKAAAMKALEIDSSLAEAHTTLAIPTSITIGISLKPSRNTTKRIAANPNYPTAHQWYSEFLMEMGRNEEAIQKRARALELDPLSLIIGSQMGGRALPRWQDGRGDRNS